MKLLSFVRSLRRKDPRRVARVGRDDNYSFRRSKTITGSASSTVSTVSEKRGQLKSMRLRLHMLRRQQRSVGVFAVVLLVVLALMYCLASQTIMSVDVTAPHTTTRLSRADTDRYAKLVDAYLAGRPGERFLFTLDQKQLSDYMQREAPEIDSVNVGASFGLGHAKLELELRTPTASWQVGSRRYYVDTAGRTFERNYYAEPLVVIQDQSGIRAEAGQQIASQRLLSFIGQIVAGAQAYNLQPIQQVIIPPGVLREIDIVLDGRGYRFRLSVERDPAGQVGDLASAIKYLDTKKLTPQYVDLRAPGKAYYR